MDFSFSVHFCCPHCGEEVSVSNEHLEVSAYPCNCGCGQAWCNMVVACPHCRREVVLYNSDPGF